MSVNRLRQWADGLWTFEGDPIRYLGFPYAVRMTIARLEDGSLWVHSPVQCTDEARATLDTLGPVRHLVTPNKLHNLFLGHWAKHYPEANVYAAPGLPRRRPDLHFVAVLGDQPEPPWQGTLEQCMVGHSLFMDEVVFLHRASRTLVLGDLVENHDPALFSPLQRAVGKLVRMIGPRAETPIVYRITFLNRRPTRAAVARILSWKPERVICVHGSCVESDAEGFLRHAFGWLLPNS